MKRPVRQPEAMDFKAFSYLMTWSWKHTVQLTSTSKLCLFNALIGICEGKIILDLEFCFQWYDMEAQLQADNVWSFFFFLLWSWICFGDPVWWYSVYSEIILKKEITNEVNIKGISYDWAWISTWWHQKRLLMRLKYINDCNQIIVMLLRGHCPCINEKLFKVTLVKYTRWQKRRFLAYDCDACDLQIRFEYCGK